MTGARAKVLPVVCVHCGKEVQRIATAIDVQRDRIAGLCPEHTDAMETRLFSRPLCRCGALLSTEAERKYSLCVSCLGKLVPVSADFNVEAIR